MGLGLFLVGVGLFALLRGRPSNPPMDQIDAESRAQLERVLEAAQKAQRPGPER
jgi:hypothetical protein